MNQDQQAQIAALRRVQRFLDVNDASLSAVNQAASRVALNTVLTELEARGAKQVEASMEARTGTQRKNELRDALRDQHMLAIAEVARTKLAHSPDIVRMRPPRKGGNDTKLIEDATAMADAADKNAAVFTADLGADFSAKLRALITDFKKAVVDRDQSLFELNATNRVVDESIFAALGAVRVLNRLVVRAAYGKTELLAGWRAAKHVRAKGGVPQGTTREVPDAPVAPAVSAPEVKAAA